MSGAKSQAAEKDVDHETISRLLLSAYPDRICKRRAEGNRSYVIAQGRGVLLSPDSHLVSSPYLIAVNVDAGEKTEGIIHMAAPVTEDAHPERMRGEHRNDQASGMGPEGRQDRGRGRRTAGDAAPFNPALHARR